MTDAFEELTDAIGGADLEAVQRSLAYEPDLSRLTGDGYTPLGLAIKGGDHRVVQVLVLAGASPNEGGKLLPLHDVSRSGDVGMASSLLTKHADVERLDEVGMTPLMVAAACDHWFVADLLLQLRADANRVNADGLRPYDLALGNGHHFTADFLRLATRGEREGVEPTAAALARAASWGDVDAIEWLLDNGAPIDEVPEEDGDDLCDALSEACSGAHEDVVDHLLRRGANPNLYAFTSPLSWCSVRDTPDTLRRLLDAGADPNQLDDDEEASPLMYACCFGNAEIAQMLIDAGADPHLQTSTGDDALRSARFSEDLIGETNPVTPVLEKAGVDVAARLDEQSETSQVSGGWMAARMHSVVWWRTDA